MAEGLDRHPHEVGGAGEPDHLERRSRGADQDRQPHDRRAGMHRHTAGHARGSREPATATVPEAHRDDEELVRPRYHAEDEHRGGERGKHPRVDWHGPSMERPAPAGNRDS